MIAFVVLSGCHDLSSLAGTQQLPAGVPDPSVYHTAAGALALYQATIADFQYSKTYTYTQGQGQLVNSTGRGAFLNYVIPAGLLTDELQAGDLGCMVIVCNSSNLDAAVDSLDARQNPGSDREIGSQYSQLQGVRNEAALGIGALAAYDPTASPALRGHLHALAGYAELLLADLYCSGIPLSTFNFSDSTSFTYAPGSSTTQVYLAALAQFDTALTLSSDSVRIQNLAWVGKARTLLALDSIAAAASAAAHVADGFAYQFLVDWTDPGIGIGPTSSQTEWTEADQEGHTGLPYRSSGDPRTAADTDGRNGYGTLQYMPLKYGGAAPGIFPMTVADWIEARLIQAEAQLQPASAPSGPWLATLNALRTNAAALAEATNNQVPPGTVLPLLTDPGLGLNSADADTARVNLLFRERAYWLFITGHRQGDLHRLIRYYHRAPNQVYPTGQYPARSGFLYGGDTDLPIPAAESVNPYFHGCLARGVS